MATTSNREWPVFFCREKFDILLDYFVNIVVFSRAVTSSDLPVSICSQPRSRCVCTEPRTCRVVSSIVQGHKLSLFWDTLVKCPLRHNTRLHAKCTVFIHFNLQWIPTSFKGWKNSSVPKRKRSWSTHILRSASLEKRFVFKTFNTYIFAKKWTIE